MEQLPRRTGRNVRTVMYLIWHEGTYMENAHRKQQQHRYDIVQLHRRQLLKYASLFLFSRHRVEDVLSPRLLPRTDFPFPISHSKSRHIPEYG